MTEPTALSVPTISPPTARSGSSLRSLRSTKPAWVGGAWKTCPEWVEPPTKLHSRVPREFSETDLPRSVGASDIYIYRPRNGAAALLDDLPKAQWMLADLGYDAEWFRDALEQKGIKPCISAANPEPCPSNTTNVDTSAAIASSPCSAASRIGAVSQRATTDVRRLSSPRSPWPQPSSSGYDQRVLALRVFMALPTPITSA